MPKRLVLCAALILCCLSLSTLIASIDLPRLGSGDLQYIGGFRLPAASANGVDFSFGGQPMAFNPANNSLFVGSYHGSIAEVSIPTPVNSSSVNALPFATFLQPFSDPTEGHISEISTSGVTTSGLMVYGNRLYGTATIFYDANNTQTFSHYSRSLQLNQPSFSGWSTVWQQDRSGFVSGWMTPVPAEWQSLLGGPALTGQCCLPIAWRTSNGPAAFAFNPAQVGAPVVGATPLLYYTLDHSTLGPWEGSNPTYGATTQITGFVVIAGTSTALYFGSNGLGSHCYGNGTPNQSLHGTYGTDGAQWCYDPTNSDKGSHAYPYRYQVWAYDLNDFAAVKAGSKQPWDVVPYAVWSINFPTTESTMRLSAAAYDAQKQLLYISQRGADPDGYANRPIVHVFHVNSSPGSVTSPAANTVSSVSLTTDKASPQVPGTAIRFTAQPAGGVGPYQYKWLISDGVTSTVAADWTASNQFMWTPASANSKYVVAVWVRSAGNTADVLEASASSSFAIVPAATTGPVTSISLVANRVAPQPPLTAITWTASPLGGVAPLQYKWFVSNGSSSSVVSDWSTINVFTWTPSTASAGHHVSVWVRSAGNADDRAEASADQGFVIEVPAATTPPTPPTTTTPLPNPTPGASATQVTITADKASPQAPGTAVVFTAQAVSGVAPYQYQWWILDRGQWTAVGAWSAIDTLRWSRNTPDDYQVAVRVRSAGSTVDAGEATFTMRYVIQ